MNNQFSHLPDTLDSTIDPQGKRGERKGRTGVAVNGQAIVEYRCPFVLRILSKPHYRRNNRCPRLS